MAFIVKNISDSLTQTVASSCVCTSPLQVAVFCFDAHSSSTWLLHFCHHSFWTFCYAVHLPGDAHKSTFPQICIHSPTCTTSILEDAIFHRMNWCNFLRGNQLKHSTTGTLATSGSRRISLILQRKRARRRIRLCCRFCALIHIVAETAIVSFHTLPVEFPLPTIS